MKVYFRIIVILAFALACGSAETIYAQDMPAELEPAAPRPPARQQYFQTMVVDQGVTSGDVTCIFCSVIVRGAVYGDAVAIWGNVDVQGTVNGDATAVAGSVRLRSGSHVTEEVAAVAGRVIRETGAVLDGEVTSLRFLFVPGQRDVLAGGLPIFFAFHVLLVFVVFAILRARRVHAIGDALIQRPLITILTGIFVNLLVVLALSVLAVGGWFDNLVSIGLPPLLILITIPGIVAFSRLLGHKLMSDAAPVSEALLGTALVVALSAIPVAGLAIYTVFGIPAGGASLVSRFGFSAGSSPAPDDDTGGVPAA